MPYTPPSSSVTLMDSSELAAARPLLGSHHGRHNSEPSLTLSGRRMTRVSPSRSYIHRHRRSPTIRASVPIFPLQADAGNDKDQQDDGVKNGNRSGWKSQTGPSSLTPSCSVLSPPESRQNSSDEDEQVKRQQEQVVLADLQAAIMSMEPQILPLKGVSAATDYISPTAESFGAASRRKPPAIDILPLRPQSADGGLIAQLPEMAMQTPEQSDPDEEEEDLTPRPPMIRKKSGELVRPALRMSKRPSSMPGTPTFVKNVHFDVQLERVRHFMQLDMPVAVSAGSSPADEYDGDTEFPFGSDSVPASKPYQWEAKITNFPAPDEINKHVPVRLDRIFLSSDNKYLVGIVAVANLAFNKHVVARFTMDHWKTVSEVEAEYNNDPNAAKLRDADDHHDRFHFNIRLADLADLETKTMFLCIKYHVNGLEFWDNNGWKDYHVNFVKKYKQGGRTVGQIGVHARTNRNIPRPHSMPPTGNTFAAARSFDSPQDDGFSRLTQQVPLPHPDDDLLETPTKRTKPAVHTFAVRYDFGSSLSAAMQIGGADAVPVQTQITSVASSTRRTVSTTPETQSSDSTVRPSDFVSAKPYHQSPGYKELVDKYCFVSTQPRMLVVFANALISMRLLHLRSLSLDQMLRNHPQAKAKELLRKAAFLLMIRHHFHQWNITPSLIDRRYPVLRDLPDPSHPVFSVRRSNLLQPPLRSWVILFTK